jgi:peroxiredoxin
MRILRFLAFASALASSAFAGLAPSPEAAKPLSTGAKAPDAMVLSVDGTSTHLANLISEKPSVLIFFRGGWCPFCSRHLAAVGEHELDLRQLGYQIIGISAEGPEKLTPTAEANHVRYRLMSDRSAAASIAYGVGYRLPPDRGPAYHENGIDLTPAPDGNGFWLPVPTAFIVDRHGIIRFVYSNSDPSIRISPEELIAAAKKVAEEK